MTLTETESVIIKLTFCKELNIVFLLNLFLFYRKLLFGNFLGLNFLYLYKKSFSNISSIGFHYTVGAMSSMLQFIET